MLGRAPSEVLLMDSAAGRCPRIGLVGGLHGSIAVGVGAGAGGVDGVLFVRFAGVAKFLAENAFVREIPTVEVTVQVWLAGVDVLGGWSRR